MVTHIIHVADIHIPNNEKERPFSEMLKEFVKEVSAVVSKYGSDSVRVVISGDIFDQKIKTTNEAKTMFHTLLNDLNGIVKTYIIAGNHDMLENNKDRMDSLNPTFEIDGVYNNVVYLDKVLNYKSGYVDDDNIRFVLYSMHDSFAKPSGFDLMCEDKKIVGLYHGEVKGAKTDLGRESENGINLDFFNGCDCVMAGHIHKHQEITHKNVKIVYSGSLFQKNAGETVGKHGFVLWDMNDMSYEHMEVKNDYRIFKFKVSDYDDVKNDKEVLKNA